MLTERAISANNAGLSGRTASHDRRIESIAEVFRILGPIAFGLAGVAIRLDAFLRNASLNLDEAALARNIIDRPWTKLFGWLDYAQIAPPGFLQVEKAIVSMFGSSEYALRFFPMLCGLASVWLCWAVCRRLLPLVPALMAFGLFALNTSVVDITTQAKPYSSDVAAALLVVLLGSKLFEPAITRRRAVTIALTGIVTSVFSLPSVFVLAGLVIACVYRAQREPSGRHALLAAAAILAVGAGGGALIAVAAVSPNDAAYMHWYWQRAFMPFPPRTPDDFLWLGRQLKATFRWTALYRASALWIAAAALGVWSLCRRQQTDRALLLLMPLVLVVGASAAGLYPFWSGRIQLFLLPLLLILVAEGADWWRRVSGTRWIWIGVAPIIVLGALGIQGAWSGWRIQRTGNVRSILEYVRDHRRPGDRIYVYYVAGQIFLYYAPRLGFAPTDYVVGSCSSVELSPVRELQALRGEPRVWVIALGSDESDRFARYLEETGTVREIAETGDRQQGVSMMMRGAALLYDLSTPASASSAADALSSSEATTGLDQLYTCYGVFRAAPDRPAQPVAR